MIQDADIGHLSDDKAFELFKAAYGSKDLAASALAKFVHAKAEAEEESRKRRK